ncbi:unnamed protein product [Malus baccata var. baccata]
MLAAGEFTDRHSRLGPSIPRVLTILSFVLEKLVARNNALVDDLNHQLSGISCDSAVIGKSLDVFHGVRPPSISIPKYLERLYKYTDCSPSCFVVGYHPDSLVLSLNVHRLLVTSVMVASKMLDDACSSIVYEQIMFDSLLSNVSSPIHVVGRTFIVILVWRMCLKYQKTQSSSLPTQISEVTQSSSLPQVVDRP